MLTGIIKCMKKAKPKPPLRWPYVAALVLLFGLSIVLRAAEIVGPSPANYSAHPLDDDSNARLVAIQKNFNRLATPPYLPVTVGDINGPSIHYLVLIDAGDQSNVAEVRQQLRYFENIMQSAMVARSSKTNDGAPATNPAQPGVNVPILMYHRTPADFEAQIEHLADHGYTSITLADLWSALKLSSPLPAKPVIITLDDGYADQLQEVAILRKYKVKATLYVINGGEASKWCIGAGAKKLPGCEAYLSWNQIRDLDREGLITIGSHTTNHPNLASLNAEQQRAEIIGGKQQLEAQLRHPIYDFAYPYGAFNSVSVQLAQHAGFKTAVTTQPGSTHTVDSLLTLTRLRDSLVLP